MSVNSLPENEVSSLKTKDSVVYRVVLTGGKTREWTLRETLTLSFNLNSLYIVSDIIILFHAFSQDPVRAKLLRWLDSGHSLRTWDGRYSLL